MNFIKNLPEIDYSPFLENLEKVFKNMGESYDAVAKQYSFNCTGCEDNCCLTRFYHHTLLEHLLIEKGFRTLDSAKREEVLEKAKLVVKKTEDADLKGITPRVMCPLNFDGLCILYNFRPMVCRLHGLEHELAKPGQPPVRSSGCDLFTKQTKNIDYIKFDRTIHYIEMAKLESSLRNASGFMEKIRHTIAEMMLL